MQNLIPPSQRAYVASHPLGKWVAIGIFFSGLINTLMPSLTSESVVALVFSPLIIFAFNLAWTVGGALCAFGLMRGKSKVEGAGMCLLASGLFTYYLAVFSVRTTAALAALFIPCLAYGCAKRAWHLATHGYVVLDVPTDQPGLRGNQEPPSSTLRRISDDS
jgi:hypothetical protein